jgi:hypothetical protein
MLSNIKKTPRGITFVLDNERTLRTIKEPRKCQKMLGKMLCNTRKMMGDVVMSIKYQATLSNAKKMKRYIGKK